MDPDPAAGSPPADEGETGRHQLSRRELLRVGVALPTLGLPFAAAACGGGHARAGHRVPATTARTDQTAASPPGPRGPRGNGQPVRFAFGGDVHFPAERDTTDPGAASPVVLADQLRSDPTHLLAPIAPVLSSADLAMVNLETAITDRGTPVAGKNFHFRSPAASFTALKAAGIDAVNMANNHSLDYGPAGLISRGG